MVNSSPIGVKDAVRIAMNYLAEFEDFIPIRDVRLEETEYDDSGDWLITLSAIDRPGGELGDLAAALGGNKRNHKIFRIDAFTGNVKSMKVRALQPVE